MFDDFGMTVKSKVKIRASDIIIYCIMIRNVKVPEDLKGVIDFAVSAFGHSWLEVTDLINSLIKPFGGLRQHTTNEEIVKLLSLLDDEIEVVD